MGGAGTANPSNAYAFDDLASAVNVARYRLTALIVISRHEQQGHP